MNKAENQADKVVEDILRLFYLTLDPDYHIALTAAKSINESFNQLVRYDYKLLNDTIRWLSINKSDIQEFDRLPKEERTALLCFATLNRNGYVREAALEKLDQIKDQRILPFILFRLADWVPLIREMAKMMLEQNIEYANPIYFIKNYKLIDWLLKIKRTSLTDIYDKILTFITLNPLDYDKIFILPEGERYFYYRAFFISKNLDSKIITSILNDKYYLIRQLLIRNIIKVKNKEEVILKLLFDKSQTIRQNAIKLVSSQNLMDFKPALQVLIFDKNAFVRQESRKLLDKISQQNFENLYLEKIKVRVYLFGSILGLSETGTKNNVPLILSFINSEESNIKTAALLGLYNLDKKISEEIAYDIIEKSNPISTKKLAGLILFKEGINLKRLRKIYDRTDYWGKRIILCLVDKFAGWSAAGDYLKTLTERNEQLTQIAYNYLGKWDKYTSQLATEQNPEDKEYVLKWYTRAKEMDLNVPDIIPFIFRDR